MSLISSVKTCRGDAQEADGGLHLNENYSGDIMQNMVLPPN